MGHPVEVVLDRGIHNRHLALARFERMFQESFFQFRNQANLEPSFRISANQKFEHFTGQRYPDGSQINPWSMGIPNASNTRRSYGRTAVH